MPCQEITFAVYAIGENKSEQFIDNFTLSINENDALLRKYEYGSYINGRIGGLYSYGVIFGMFEKLYGFTKGLNGFAIRWEYNKDGSYQELEVGTISWKVDTWRVRRVR